MRPHGRRRTSGQSLAEVRIKDYGTWKSYMARGSLNKTKTAGEVKKIEYPCTTARKVKAGPRDGGKTGSFPGWLALHLKGSD